MTYQQVMRPKSNPVRNEEYRRLVASLPCSNCGIWNYSQAAHGPALGRGMKADDLFTFPLCAPRLGTIGCHAAYDQYELGDADWRREQAIRWAAKARKSVLQMKQLSKRLREMLGG